MTDAVDGPDAAAAAESETVATVLSTRVLTCGPRDTLQDVFHTVAREPLDDITSAFVVEDGRLVGVFDVAGTESRDPATPAADLASSEGPTIGPGADREQAVWLALDHDVTALAVTDEDGRFLGALTPRILMHVMHEEHLEDALLVSGLRGRGSHIITLATANVRAILRSRAPWLLVGTVMGLGLGFVSSLFEHTLRESVAVAYFVPVVAYIADSVGAQSEGITVRALATIKLRYPLYLARELAVGVLLGVVIGLFGGLGAALIAGEADIGAAVGLALLCGCTVAAFIGSALPIAARALGADPAVVSGPLATAIQDALTVVIYFLFAVLLVG